jgi:signal transduction histidine kinase
VKINQRRQATILVNDKAFSHGIINALLISSNQRKEGTSWHFVQSNKKEDYEMKTEEIPYRFGTLLKPAKILIIAILVAVISLLHYSTLHGTLGVHIPHRELFFIPILLASFWFGLNFGFVTSLVVSLIYAPHVFVHTEAQNNIWPVSFQIVVFNLVALMMGMLVERGRRQQEKILNAEKLAVLGRAAIAVGHEMKDLLGALRRFAGHAKGLNSTELDREFNREMSRLEQMVDILSSFVTTEPVQLFSYDVNEIIGERVNHHKKAAGKLGVILKTDLDDNGCPSQVNTEAIGWVMDQIIVNALEVSPRGKTIQIRSHRSSENCEVEIEDEGSGIKPEHFLYIFKPFFTTKKNGHGLALSASRKIMQDMGGDIQVASEMGKGAKFTVTIPREYSGKPLAVDPVRTLIRGEKVERIYRE